MEKLTSKKKKLKQKPHTKFHSIVMNVQGSSYITRFHFYTYKKQYRKKSKAKPKKLSTCASEKATILSLQTQKKAAPAFAR